MHIKDRTTEQLQSLIRNTVDERLDEYFGDLDEGNKIKGTIQAKFIGNTAKTAGRKSHYSRIRSI